MFLREGFHTMAMQKKPMDVALTPWDSHNIHKALVQSYQNACRSYETAKLQMHEAWTAQLSARSALYLYESELFAHEEATGEGPGIPYVTQDPDTPVSSEDYEGEEHG